jgi:hypothetical protein
MIKEDMVTIGGGGIAPFDNTNDYPGKIAAQRKNKKKKRTKKLMDSVAEIRDGLLKESFTEFLKTGNSRGHHIGTPGIKEFHPLSHFAIHDHQDNPGGASRTMRGRVSYGNKQGKDLVHYGVKFRGLSGKNTKEIIDDGGEHTHLDLAEQMHEQGHISDAAHDVIKMKNSQEYTIKKFHEHGIHGFHYTNENEGIHTKCVITTHPKQTEIIKGNVPKSGLLHKLHRFFTRRPGKQKLLKNIDDKRGARDDAAASKIEKTKQGNWRPKGKTKSFSTLSHAIRARTAHTDALKKKK